MTANEKADALKENPYVPDPKCTHVSGGYFQRYVDKDGEFAVRRCACWLKWKGLDTVLADRKTVAAGAQ